MSTNRSDPPAVYRAPMRSRLDGIPVGAAVERALELGLCGMGGRLPDVPVSLVDALVRTQEHDGLRTARRLERFAAAFDGSFVWTRDVDGLLHLGRLHGPWVYDADPAAIEVDLVHVRACVWASDPIPDAHAPPPVLATFARGGRNWQRIRAEEASPLSARVWDDATRAQAVRGHAG